MFKNNLSNLDWTLFYATDDPNIAWQIMYANIRAIIDDMCPIKKYNIKQVKDPWISNEILKSIHDKDRLLTRVKRRRDLDDLTAARRSRNEVKNLVKKAKANFVSENLNSFKNDSKEFWKSLSDVLPTKSNKNSQQIFLKDSNGVPIVDNVLAANMMNEFFSSIGPNLAKDMNDPWVYSGDTSVASIQDIQTNRLEVIKLIKDSDTS